MRKIRLVTVSFLDLFPQGVDMSNPPDIQGKFIPFINNGERAYLSGSGKHVGGLISCPDCLTWLSLTQEETDTEISCDCGASFFLVLSTA